MDQIPQIFFTNLKLLGFDAFEMERKWRIPFNKGMFHLPNKKGFEVVMFFLFDRLDPSHCKEQFRDCWPVSDKKQEQNFRKVVNSWLNEIAKDPDAHFPRVMGSVLLSPGGDKFYQLVHVLSRYVVLKTILNENGFKQRDLLKHQVLTSDNQGISSVMLQVSQCAMIRHRKSFIQELEQMSAVQDKWKEHASELVKTYRNLNKNIRDLEQDLKIEAQKSLERSSMTSSRRKSGVNEYDLNVQSVRRAQRVQEVRDGWKIAEKFCLKKEKEREVIESILHDSADKYKINASELDVKVPDYLLRECEQEIQRRNVENIYEGGKLNLVSLIHLWNLSLHLYIEKLHCEGVADFNDSVSVVNTLVHTLHAYASELQSLKSQLEKETIRELKKNIEKLKSDLDYQVFASHSPNSIKTTSLGFGLIPPTPPVNFEPSDTKTPTNMVVNMQKSSIEQVDTPEAALQLMDSINKRVYMTQNASPLVQGTPLYAPRQDLINRRLSTEHRSPLGEGAEVAIRGQRQGIRPKTGIDANKKPLVNPPKAAQQKLGKPTSRIPHANLGISSSKLTKGNVKETESGTQLIQHGIKAENQAKHKLSEQIIESYETKDYFDLWQKQVMESQKENSDSNKGSPLSLNRAQPLSLDMNNLDGSVLSSIPMSPVSSDFLADRLVDELMSSGGGNPRDNIIEELTKDLDPSIKSDKIARTPPMTGKSSWHEHLLENSYGPLSSTKKKKVPTATLR